MRFETTTKLKPGDVMARAREFFGRELGLEERANGDSVAVFEGGGGGVGVTVTPSGDDTEVELLSREWDYQARQFLLQLND